MLFACILALSYPLLTCCWSVTQCVCEILIIFSVMYIVIVKFSDWQGALGMRRACMLSGVGVDGHMGGRAAHYTALVL